MKTLCVLKLTDMRKDQIKAAVEKMFGVKVEAVKSISCAWQETPIRAFSRDENPIGKKPT